jgi:hypothetical protein
MVRLRIRRKMEAKGLIDPSRFLSSDGGFVEVYDAIPVPGWKEVKQVNFACKFSLVTTTIVSGSDSFDA